jgi:putative transposase
MPIALQKNSTTTYEMTYTAMKRAQESKDTEKVLRVVKVGGRVLERDVIGATNIGLRYLNLDGSLVGVGLYQAHEARMKLATAPRSNPTDLFKLSIAIYKY